MARGLTQSPSPTHRVTPLREAAASAARQRRAVIAVVSVAVIVTLFLRYLSLARAMPVSADGASNALQAHDMLDGNLLLRGWTLTDVSFYTNELVVLAIVELLRGHHPDVLPVTAAVMYTLLVAGAALLAKGRATGREAAARMAIAVAIIATPTPGLATSILLGSPDHTGTGVPLLAAWLLLDRGAKPYLVGLVLACGQVADPLVMYVGALPLVLVSGLRLLRDDEPASRVRQARLAVAGIGSVLTAQAILLVIRLSGGFGVHAPIARFSPPAELPDNLWTAAQGIAAIFGAFPPDRQSPTGVVMALLHLAGLLAVSAAVYVTVARTLRKRGTRDRVTELIAVAIVVNLAAFVASTLPGDLGTARQLAAVLPLGAALAGRVWGPPITAAHPRTTRILAVLPVLLALELVVLSAGARPASPDGADAAAWLQARGHRYGLGSYWLSNNITLITHGQVHPAPVTGSPTIRAYRWESRADWYDPARRDARFLIIDRHNPGYGTVADALAQFGEPVTRVDLTRATILLYDHNLLVGLPAYCAPNTAASIAECPKHQFPTNWHGRRTPQQHRDIRLQLPDL